MTNSLSFPNMFDVARNKVGVISDNESIVNRSRLLILTEPTELYHNPDFGVGLKRHLWHYNTENEKAIMKDRIVDQLRLHEPCCVPDKTAFADGLLFTGVEDDNTYQKYNRITMTVGIKTIFGDDVTVKLQDLQSIIDAGQLRYKDMLSD